MDPTNLAPAPWKAVRKTDTLHLDGDAEIGFAELLGPRGGSYRGVRFEFTNDEAEFVTLARNAFDVMLRRGWTARRLSTGSWIVQDSNNQPLQEPHRRPDLTDWFEAADPFTALVEADKWYRENVEGKPC